MQIDRYIKLVLTVIALALALIACKPLFESKAAAEGALTGVQFSGGMGGFWILDTRSGDVWAYSGGTNGQLQPQYAGKLVQLGQPLVNGRR